MSSPPAAANSALRSRRFNDDPHPRFWWHKLHGTDYVPPIYAMLTDEEWAVMEAWYAATFEADVIGEINVPAMSLIQGFICGGGLTRITQLGHYFGYSTLLIGFWLRYMDQGGKLVTIDIDPVATGFAHQWVVERAGLGEWVEFRLCDSASDVAVRESRAVFGSMPQLILLDSSHQYDHTLRELDRWVPEMVPHSLMLLHDTSHYARSFDAKGRGGVQQALDDWVRRHPREVEVANLNRRVGEPGAFPYPVYQDGCGMGILQKL